MFNRIFATIGGVVWSWQWLLLILYPNDTLTGFVKATKTCRAAKRYWRPLNLKRSLPVYFFEFLVESYNIIQSKHFVQSFMTKIVFPFEL